MTHKTPLVSISVVTYNHHGYIKQCLDGILMQQTNFPFEIILGEDESTDGTREICIEYANKYPDKINLFLRSRKDVIYINGNPTGRYNFIENLKASKGKYMALCEGDDYWTDPLKLQKQVDFLENNEDYVLTYHDAKIVDECGHLIKSSKLPDYLKKDFSQWELTTSPSVLTLSMCFRNIKIDYPKEFIKVLNGDTFLISLLGQEGKGKYMKNIKKAVYRQHSRGIWSGINKFNQQLVQLYTFLMLKKYYERIGDNKVASFLAEEINSKNLNLIAISKSLKEKKFLLLHFVKLRKYKTSIWYILYSLITQNIGKGYIFERNLKNSLKL